MTTYTTIETISDQYFDIAFQSQTFQPCKKYVTLFPGDDSKSQRIKVRIDLICEGKKRRAVTITELLYAIEKLGVAPQQYVVSEPVTMARMVAFLEDKGSIIYSHPLWQRLMQDFQLTLEDYIPRWVTPNLVWYTLDTSPPFDRLKLIEQRLVID